LAHALLGNAGDLFMACSQSTGLALALTLLGAAVGQATDRLILRNLDIITDRTVTALDEDGLLLDRPRQDGADRITWDEVERGRVAIDQARFDKLLSELGTPLYRIRQRLKVGDYEAAGEPAELFYARFSERKSQTAYLVCQATMWSRLAHAKREAAVEPYLRCYELLRSKAAVADRLPGKRRLNVDPANAISSELLPVWFDAAGAKAALPPVEQAIRSLAQPRRDGVYVYYATLAIAAGETAEAERVMALLNRSQEPIATWREIVLAEQELAAGSPGAAMERLKSRQGATPEPCRPVSAFLLGMADMQSTDGNVCREGLLSLLTLPAVYSRQHPELGAAGLYHAAVGLDKLKDAAGATALRRELASRYVGTYFELKLRGEAKH
jgi:hypothetical protein